jgi:hypothetical protein
MQILIEVAEAGKFVTALVELRGGLANIRRVRALEATSARSATVIRFPGRFDASLPRQSLHLQGVAGQRYRHRYPGTVLA